MEGDMAMTHNLAENIRKFRKDRNMTQEDLAEKLGLTLGTISKWERGSSEPELSYLMQLAQIFHVSLDALLGFSILSNNADALVDKIDKLLNEREFEAAKKECEAALLIYPNHFKVVYCVATTYAMIGVVTQDKDALKTAIKHLRHSLDLFAQNSDPTISVIEIQNTIADCYLAMKETQKGIDELKKNNVSGINDADIAINMIAFLKQDQEGLKYAQRAFSRHGSRVITVMFSLMAYYVNEREPEQGIFAANWMLDYLKLFKKDAQQIAFVDKYVAGTLLIMAFYYDVIGDWDKSLKTMREAIECAEKFDQNPCFDTKNTVFLEDIEDVCIYDSLGVDSKTALERLMDEFQLWDVTSDRFKEAFLSEMKKD